MNPGEQADDLKAFERRMIEIVGSLQPSIWRWRIILLILVLFTLMTFYFLLMDFSFSSSISMGLSTTTTTATTTRISSDDLTMKQTTFFSQIISMIFRKEISFSISFGLLIFAFLFGIHRKIFASSIIVSRFRYILADYNMSCDDKGHLIIKPRPTTIF